MDLFVKEVVFNGKLQGEAVHIKGYDSNGDKCNNIYLVQRANYDHLILISPQGTEYTFYRDEFENGNPERLTLTVLEEPKEGQ